MWLAIPLAVSSVGWIFYLAILHNAPAASLEGDLYLACFIGVISFVLVGPLTGVMLSGPMLRGKMIGFWKFAGLFLLVGVPAISFEMISRSVSFLYIFVPRELCTDPKLRCFGAMGTVAACLYAVYLLIMYWQGRRGVERATVTAVLLVFGSLALIVMRILVR
ncbi:MAG TPA: hypothetical protein VGZ00_12670 [Candidatus Baltobacteraceae bacterium]|nr:hypothetical protein [Candidatus Baltobacteraceae bacterium]